MKKIAIAFLLTGIFPLCMDAQNTQYLEQGIQIYNVLKDTAETPGIKTGVLLKMADESETLLKKVARDGTEDEVKAAKYFLAVLTLVRGETYYKGTRAEKELVLPVFQSVEKEFDRLAPSEFPIRYSYFGKNFKVEYSNFEYSRMKFYAEISEIYIGKDVANMKKYARKALDVNASNSDYLQYVIYYFLNNESNEAEKIVYAQKFIYLYSRMDSIDRRSLNDQKTGVNYLKKNAEILFTTRNTDWDKTGELSAVKAIELVNTGGLDSLACRFWDQAVTKGITLSDAERISVLDLYDKTGFKSAGLKLCNKMLTTQSSTNCDGYDVLAKYYQKFGDALKARSMKQSAEKCRKDLQDQADAEARRRAKEARKANRNHGYLGAYVLRIAQRPKYIDWGGTLDFPVGSRTLLEFSYMQAINDQDYLLMERLSNKEGVDDLNNPHWDGFYAHVGFKKMERSGNSYRGMLFTYNQRNFQPQTTFVTPKLLPLPLQEEVTFEPKMTTYGFIFNFGAMSLGKPFGVDMYMGVGPTYSIFKLNNADYSREDFDFSNAFLQQRKEMFWGFQIRMGMTLGLRL